MSDLPSRASMNDFEGVGDAAQILDAYVSGRLVDRETIDYEAAAKWIEANDPETLETWQEILPFATSVVAAAIGDTSQAVIAALASDSFSEDWLSDEDSADD